MYHINNNAFSCVLKVVRLQSDIRNAVGKLFHTEDLETANSQPFSRRHKVDTNHRRVARILHWGHWGRGH